MKTIITILLLLPLIGYSQFKLDSNYVEKPYYAEKDGRILVGKHGRQGVQFLAITGAMVSVGIPALLIGDKIHNPVIEEMGGVLIVNSLPFITISINKFYIAFVNQEYLESKYNPSTKFE